MPSDYVWWAGKNDIFRIEDVSANCSEQFNPPRDRSIPHAGADNWTSWWPEVGCGNGRADITPMTARAGLDARAKNSVGSTTNSSPP